jgi:hypothetical protein
MNFDDFVNAEDYFDDVRPANDCPKHRAAVIAEWKKIRELLGLDPRNVIVEISGKDVPS